MPGQLMSDIAASQPKPITADLIIRQAWLLFRQSLDRTGHIWIVAFSVELVQAFDRWLTAGRTDAIIAMVASTVWVWVFGAGTRGLLLDRQNLWALDADFWRYAGASVVLALPLVAFFVMALLLGIVSGIILFVGVVLILGLLLRFILWPIGLLVGYRAMTLLESAQLMKGQIASYVGACLQLGLLFLTPMLLMLVITYTLPHALHEAAEVAERAVQAICETLLTIASASLGAAMYLLAARRAE